MIHNRRSRTRHRNIKRPCFIPMCFEFMFPAHMLSEFTSVKDLIENSRVIRFTPRGADKHGYWNKIIKEDKDV